MCRILNQSAYLRRKVVCHYEITREFTKLHWEFLPLGYDLVIMDMLPHKWHWISKIISSKHKSKGLFTNLFMKKEKK